MKKIIWTCIGAGLLLLAIPSHLDSYKAPVVEVIEVKTVKEPTKVETIHGLIDKYALMYAVSSEVMHEVIKCESQYQNIQSRIINKKGEQEDSWGIVQIHLPSHPNVTKAQALDKRFAIEFLAKKLSQGKGKLWTCARTLKLV